MPTFRIWYIGTKDFAIEEASSELEACQKTGRNAEECEVQRIPEENIVQEARSETFRAAVRNIRRNPNNRLSPRGTEA